jgi:FKBP-type peptidyl-prolyl cis-trans isomerase
MRRFLAIIALPLLVCLAMAGCSSSKPASAPSTPATANANAAVKVAGTFGTTPVVTIPKAKAANKLVYKTLIQGTGATVTKTDFMATNFVLYFWNGTSSTLKLNTFTSNPAMISGDMMPGLQTALIGQKIGSRILAVIPPAEGYGTSGNPQIGATGSTTLVFVIDLIKSYADTASATGTQESDGGGSLPTVSAHPGSAPTLNIPSAKPPAQLVTKTLIKGTGPKLVKGQYVVTQYTGYIWRTKKVFDSSWQAGSPFGFVVGASPEQVISGWDDGLVGQTVGSRVMLVIPPKDAYGSAGQSQAGITGTDTLVFVVDIIDAFK